ncbi:MAG: hypothetical protein ACR2IK_03875 [Chloroflexota bacterium]
MQQLEQDRDRARSTHNFRDNIQALSATLSAGLENLSFHERQEFLRLVLEHVEVENWHVKIIFRIPLPNDNSPFADTALGRSVNRFRFAFCSSSWKASRTGSGPRLMPGALRLPARTLTDGQIVRPSPPQPPPNAAPSPSVTSDLLASLTAFPYNYGIPEWINPFANGWINPFAKRHMR